jgi:hypothetical protein
MLATTAGNKLAEANRPAAVTGHIWRHPDSVKDVLLAFFAGT